MQFEKCLTENMFLKKETYDKFTLDFYIEQKSTNVNGLLVNDDIRFKNKIPF